MKCLEKHTANGAMRLRTPWPATFQHHLADGAVPGRPPSAGYRFSKFLLRHRGPVLAATLLLLALVGGIVGTTFGMIRADRARADEARQRRDCRSKMKRRRVVAARGESARPKDREAEQRAKAEKAHDRTRQARDDMTSSVTGDSHHHAERDQR